MTESFKHVLRVEVEAGALEMLTMVSDFAAAIREGRQPRVTSIDGLRAVEATIAAYESDRTGKTVEVQRA